MSRLASVSSGDFLNAANWALIDAIAYLNSETARSNPQTTYAESQTFTPGAIEIDGIAVKIASRAAGATGTMSVRLAQAGVLVADTEVTVNVTDIPESDQATASGGWFFLKFSAPVTLAAATAYTVSAKTSVALQVELWRDGTNNNWARYLRTTTNQAPVAGDDMVVAGEFTGPGADNSYIITVDETAATDYGSASTSQVTPAIAICAGGTLQFNTGSGVNYLLRVSGCVIAYAGGDYNQGTVAGPIPRNGSAFLEFDCAADGDFGLIFRNGSTAQIQGLSRTVSKNVIACKLNTDEAIGQTALGVDTDTGWLSGDEIAIAKTSRSTSQEVELRVLNGNAGASNIDITVALGVAHSGTAPTQADIILLTRNVGVRSTLSTAPCYIVAGPTAQVDIDWASFRYIGDATAGKRGVVVQTTTGSFSMRNSCIRDTEEYGLNISGGSTNNIDIRFNTFYLLNSSQTNVTYFMLVDATSGSEIEISDNYFFDWRNAGANDACVSLLDLGIKFSRNVFSGGVNGAAIFLNQQGGVFLEFEDNVVYGSRGGAPSIVQNTGILIGGGTIDGFTSWNNAGVGFALRQGSVNLVINDLVLRGNLVDNLLLQGGHANLTFNRLISSANALATTNGIDFGANSALTNIIFNDCEFSQVSGTFAAHSVDILCSSTHVEALFNNCLFGAATLVSLYPSLSASSIIKFHKYNETDNNHRWYTKYGIAQSTGAGLTDTTVRTPGSLGLRMAPEDATTGFSWEFKILARANTGVFWNGFFQKNAAFGADEVTCELFLPGSTVADDTATLTDLTGDWQVASLAANYTGDVDLYAIVRITAKTATANAYVYLDDFYNGTNEITALDVWDEGQPSEIMFEQLGDAASVWSVALDAIGTPGTTGEKIKDALQLDEFVGLK